MHNISFEAIRLPAAVLLLALVGLVLVTRGEGGTEEPVSATPITAIDAGGAVEDEPDATPVPTPQPTTRPEATPTATPEPELTPEPTPAPAANGFGAELLVCRSIDGSRCNGQLDRIPGNLGSMVALVRFQSARAGDVIEVVLSGPGGTISGGPYALQGSGRGYYYTTFQVGGLPAGDYSLVAIRNGEQVASSSLVKPG